MVGQYSGAPMSDPKSYLELDQIKRIIDATDNPQYKMLFIFLSRTGRRVSEIVGKEGLLVKDIDFDNGLINFTILKRKTPTKSLLPVEPDLLTSLKAFIEPIKDQPEVKVFPMTRQRADQVFKKSAAKVSIFTVGNSKRNKPHLHLLRHSFAIHGAKTLENPADLVTLKEMLGHSRVDTTMFYLKFNPTEQKELLRKMWKR